MLIPPFSLLFLNIMLKLVKSLAGLGETFRASFNTTSFKSVDPEQVAKDDISREKS